jgi:hypothetical protein
MFKILKTDSRIEVQHKNTGHLVFRLWFDGTTFVNPFSKHGLYLFGIEYLRVDFDTEEMHIVILIILSGLI